MFPEQYQGSIKPFAPLTQSMFFGPHPSVMKPFTPLIQSMCPVPRRWVIKPFTPLIQSMFSVPHRGVIKPFTSLGQPMFSVPHPSIIKPFTPLIQSMFPVPHPGVIKPFTLLIQLMFPCHAGCYQAVSPFFLVPFILHRMGASSSWHGMNNTLIVRGSIAPYWITGVSPDHWTVTGRAINAEKGTILNMALMATMVYSSNEQLP